MTPRRDLNQELFGSGPSQPVTLAAPPPREI